MRHIIKPDNNLGKTIRALVYATLLLSTVFTGLFGNRLWPGFRPRSATAAHWTLVLGPLTFVLFVLVFAIDRALLVQRQRYPAGRALFQVACGVVFLTFLWPRPIDQLSTSTNSANHAATAASRLLHHRDPQVRLAVCELLDGEVDDEIYQEVEHIAQTDISPLVRQTCQLAARRLLAD